MPAMNSGYPGVRMTSGANGVASGNRVNLPVVASTTPSRRYPSWSLHDVVQSLLWYQMKNRPWSTATRHTIQSARRAGIAQILVHQFAIQALDLVDQSIESVAPDDRLTPFAAHVAPARRVRGQQRHAIGKRRRVA